MPANMSKNATERIDATLTYIGYGRYGAAMNMAIDEAMMRAAEKHHIFFIRFYDFTKPSVILASSDSAANITGMGNGVDFTRRISAGKPIYIDDNVLSYSVAGPAGFRQLGNSTDIHHYLGKATADALEATVGNGHRMEFGAAPAGHAPYSIRPDGGEPIAGHGQHISSGHSFLYHGVIAVGRWNADAINASIRLKRDHYERIKALPCVAELAGKGASVERYKELLIHNMLSEFRRRFTSDSVAHGTAAAEMMEAAETALHEGSPGREHGYASTEWLFRKDIPLKEDSSFCLLYEG